MVSASSARRFDLHLHSTRSDGVCEPEDVLERCAEGGLDIVALTDHDISAELRPGVWTFGDRSITLLAGVELSGVHEGREYHLLVYFPDAMPDHFRAFCVDRAKERACRYQAAVDNIGLGGVPDAGPEACAGHRALTRHHLARALVDAGHADDVRDAFRRYADHGHGHVPTVTLPFVDAIRIAREAGGVTSWAHPPLPALKEHLQVFVDAGLHGLEGLRPHMSSAHAKKVRKMARRHGLFLTGGSDWHGWHGMEPGLFHVDRGSLRGFLDALDSAT